LPVIHSTLNWIKRIVGWTVASVLAWMVILALVQVILRRFFDIGLPWADQQLRLMVLWIGLLGGVLAAAESRHIHIDLLDHYLSKPLKKIAGRVMNTVAGLGTLYLAYLSIGFILSEKQAGLVYEGILFGVSLPLWYTELVIPIGFALMGLFLLAPIRVKPPSTSRA
jgi:TRAP-type C4-dicarboxylate transport system permease small subunit